MAKAPRKSEKPAIKDEPGADQRFSNILKRALNTPPPRKKGEQPKPKKSTKEK